jgi:hypothetical protein
MLIAISSGLRMPVNASSGFEDDGEGGTGELGGVEDVGLSEARQRFLKCRMSDGAEQAVIVEPIDPIQDRQFDRRGSRP